MRSSKIHINYNGKNITESLMNYVTDLSYTDASSGELDDLSITVSDRDNKWQKSWAPVEGDKVSVAIEVFNWYKEGDQKKYPCGTFHVDGLTFTGPPDLIDIKAASFPVSSDARQVKRTKVWEKVKLSTISADIAKRAGLKLVREVPDDPTYDRIEQQEQTDLAFLLDLTKQEGIAVKVTEGKLVLFDEAKFEKGKSVATFERGKDNLIDYNFEWSAANCAYRACEVTYEESTKTTSTSKKKGTKKAVSVTKKVTYTPPGAPANGPVLRIKETAKSQADALRIAKNRLRERNKQANRATMTIVGDIRIAAGVVVTIVGFGKFDGKYIVDKVTHQVGSNGYVSRMELRKVLGW
ncbi:hypothetical protein BVG16_16330 [Paenibacillus selenitireducens]|uniref:Late control protein n=1 Tax=Paenibacillus selenitireducens TaxID=1324314 RepID=A0A1T2XA11_9BACL|nr:contractile injection system protein, VgrG/Pvc8 family [Paenibacillus selenitireducens]OPA76737.1 hypothetical protein BVG16_16330 [Paenibacillus selenitireducens]